MKLLATDNSMVNVDRLLAMLPNEASDNEVRLLFDTGQEQTITKRTATQLLTGTISDVRESEARP